MNDQLEPTSAPEPETEPDFGLIDQTGFISDEPSREQLAVVTDPAAAVAPTRQPWFKSRRNLIVLGAVGLVLLMVLTILAASMRRQSTLLPSDAFSHPSPSPELSPIQQRVSDLKAELKAADPTKQELTYPPVISELSIPTLKQ